MKKQLILQQSKLGDFKTEILATGTKNLLFEPTEKFTKDHDIKLLKNRF